MYSSSPCNSVDGNSLARTLKWIAMPSSRGSSWPRDQTQVSWDSCTASGLFTAEPSGKPILIHTWPKIHVNKAKEEMLHLVRHSHIKCSYWSLLFLEKLQVWLHGSSRVDCQSKIVCIIYSLVNCCVDDVGSLPKSRRPHKHIFMTDDSNLCFLLFFFEER